MDGELAAIEGEMRPDQEGLSLLFAQVPGAIWATDRDLCITYAVGRRVGGEGACPDEWVGRTIQDFLGTDDPSHPVLAHHLSVLTGRSSAFDYELGDRVYDVRIEPCLDAGGAIAGCVGVMVDVTERMRSQERLLQVEAWLSEAQQTAHVGSFTWDIERRALLWSDELCRIHGIDPSEPPSVDALLARVHPDDLASLRALALSVLRRGEPFSYEYRIARSDGAVRMLQVRGDVVKDGAKKRRIVGSFWDVTDRWETTRRLTASIALVQATLEATADGILVVDPAGKIAAYNQQFLTMWKVRPEIARSSDDEGLLELVTAQLEEPDTFLRRVRELYAKPEADSFDVLHFCDGRVVERYSRPKRVDDEVVGRVWSFRDVTERERLLQGTLFLSDASRLLVSLDVEEALEAVAPLAVPFLGESCAIDSLVGAKGPRRIVGVADGSARGAPSSPPPAVLAGHPLIYAADGRSHLATPLLARGQTLGVFIFAARPPRVYAEQDLDFAEELARRAALSLENARLYRKTQDALSARDEFFSIAAHELRGPLTAIHLAAQGISQTRLSPASAARMAAIIEREDRRLAGFVDELLDVARIRTGRLFFELEPVDLRAIVLEVAARFSLELTRSGSTLSTTTEGEVVGYWDPSRLDQVVTNLLSNAIKFGATKPIDVSLRAAEACALLVVRDRGIGMDPALVPKIFEPFERGVSSRNYGGLGLGLYIVSTIVEGLGGEIRVETAVGAGSTFTVVLPRKGAP